MDSPPASPRHPTPRTRVRRLPDRGAYDFPTLAAILDEGLVAHVGFVADGQPYVIPTAYARDGERLLLHGSVASRMVRHLGAGIPVCVTVTLLDGLVLARSLFNHSMNYRSVVVLGTARPIAGSEAKLEALQRLTEHLMPGRSQEARQPSPQELAATEVLAVPLAEASAKVRSGPPRDPDKDLALPVWAGVLPLELRAGVPQPAPDLAAGAPLPPSLRSYPR
ncbi:MAG TPA: pyridoxamine 5'-phosphate oxidase family protein [Thermoanaerobaculia bacterium]|nr:pyridoxamine 5'-phosphate oxidase family protein [Thermoanaerobaculia bacterium]